MAAALATIGHNNPPEPTPFEAIKVHIDDLMTEAKNWCDGQPIESQDQADLVARLKDDFLAAQRAADEARKKENEPFDEGKARVQAKYAPLIADTKTVRGVTVIAVEALRATLQPWLKKLDDEQKAAAEEARRLAQEAADKAAEAMRQAEVSDLGAREEAEALVAEANRAGSAAKAAENARPLARGEGRATGLRSYWTPVLDDPRAALVHYVSARPEQIKSFLCQLAMADVSAGKRQIPGFTVKEDKRAV